MMKVTIYTETTLAGPGTGNGKYGAVVEYVTKKGESVTREVYGEETTWYRSVLAAAAKGLRLLTRPCEVEIVTGCAFVASIVATHFSCPIITLVVCHRINRYNDMGTEKGKGFRTLIFCTELSPETITKTMVIISKYEVEYKETEDIFNRQ